MSWNKFLVMIEFHPSFFASESILSDFLMKPKKLDNIWTKVNVCSNKTVVLSKGVN